MKSDLHTSNYTRKNNITVIWIFLLALVLRMLWIMQYQQSPLFNYPLLDFTFFSSRAHEILAGHWFSDNYLFNPLYPLYLSLVYTIFGTDLFFPRLIQAVLGSINVLLVFRIAIYAFDRSTAVYAAILTATFLPLIYFDAILMSTCLITFLVLCTSVLLIHAQNRNQNILYLASGILFGFVILGRPNFLLLIIPFSIWIFISETATSLIRKIAKISLFTSVALLVISPITIHHWFQNHEFIIVAPHGGINFYIGNNPEATGTYMSIPGISDLPGKQVLDSQRLASESLGRELTSDEVSQYWINKSKVFFSQQPIAAIKLFLRKIALYWNKREIPSEYSLDFDSNFHSFLRLPLPTFAILGPLGLVGLLMFFFNRSNNWSRASLPILVIAGMMVAVIIFFVHARYRMTVVPWISILGGYAISEFVVLLKSRSWRNLSLYLVLLIPSTAFCNLDLVNRNDLPGYYNLANAYYQAGNNQMAIHWLETILDKSESVKTRLLLGNIQMEIHDLDAAKNNFRTILNIDSHNYEALLNLAIILTQQQEFENAYKLFKYGIMLDREKPEAYFNLAILLSNQERITEAITILDKTSKLKMTTRFREQITSLKSALKKRQIALGDRL